MILCVWKLIAVRIFFMCVHFLSGNCLGFWAAAVNFQKNQNKPKEFQKCNKSRTERNETLEGERKEPDTPQHRIDLRKAINFNPSILDPFLCAHTHAHQHTESEESREKSRWHFFWGCAQKKTEMLRGVFLVLSEIMIRRLPHQC